MWWIKSHAAWVPAVRPSERAPANVGRKLTPIGLRLSLRSGDGRPVPRDRQGCCWNSYPRQEVAERFGHDYSRNWGQGVVQRGNEFFFFVTLEKEDLPTEHRYKDRFLSREVFEWQRQNRTRRDPEAGRSFRNHVGLGISIQLFVRKHSKVGGKGAPFFYCGQMQFIDWEGDQPITVRWRLSEPVPDSLWAIFQTPDLEGESQ